MICGPSGLSYIYDGSSLLMLGVYLYPSITQFKRRGNFHIYSTAFQFFSSCGTFKSVLVRYRFDNCACTLVATLISRFRVVIRLVLLHSVCTGSFWHKLGCIYACAFAEQNEIIHFPPPYQSFLIFLAWFCFIVLFVCLFVSKSKISICKFSNPFTISLSASILYSPGHTSLYEHRAESVLKIFPFLGQVRLECNVLCLIRSSTRATPLARTFKQFIPDKKPRNRIPNKNKTLTITTFDSHFNAPYDCSYDATVNQERSANARKLFCPTEG